jgi:hypothetical protein
MHIVSPEAIREALKEEKEEALGHSQRRPFSQYSSFHALKQRKFSIDHSPPPVISATSLSIPFSPPQSIKLKNNFDDEDEEHNFDEVEEIAEGDQEEEEEEEEEEEKEKEYEEPKTPFPTSSSFSTNNTKQQEKLKRPPNAYLLFNRDMRRKLLKQSPKMTVAEISKEVGDWWKALPNVSFLLADKKETPSY